MKMSEEENLNVLMLCEGDPLILWVYEPKLGMSGFYGVGPEGRACVGVNLASKFLKDAIESYGIEVAVFCLNIWVLHELSHWATGCRRGHREWDRFLVKLLLEIME
jgi:hypothetical protein